MFKSALPPAFGALTVPGPSISKPALPPACGALTVPASSTAKLA
eukprot:CAMPEP_0168537646 /NCGR_PEP_ID=MMETSP0405-20121227/20513_1 /TAXON_ID=498012 /ORGANISM="Trichosphaerium sp, Strain Am-I-7 wt" /LENGTH=43 /DNA_ID= /DNA_START= /DNA_END= /DNA_ORIENTATION=